MECVACEGSAFFIVFERVSSRLLIKWAEIKEKSVYRPLKYPKIALVYSSEDKIFRVYFLRANFAVDFIYSSNKIRIMNIKERVLTAMKMSYAKYGFKKEELSSLTDIISANLKDDSTDEDITAALTASEGYAKMMQTVYNRGISETNKKYEGYIPKPQDTTTPPTPPAVPPTGALTMEQVQEMIVKANENRQKEIDDAVKAATAPFLQQQEQARLATLLAGHDKLKTIPKMFSGKYMLDKEENLDTLAAQIETDYAAFKQELVSSGQFVEAPTAADTQTETDDFVKQMQEFGQRNTPTSPAPSAK